MRYAPANSWACSATFCSSHQHLVVIVLLAFDQWLFVCVVVGQVEQGLEGHLAEVITFQPQGAIRRRFTPAWWLAISTASWNRPGAAVAPRPAKRFQHYYLQLLQVRHRLFTIYSVTRLSQYALFKPRFSKNSFINSFGGGTL
jgi:hypothetical protein